MPVAGSDPLIHQIPKGRTCSGPLFLYGIKIGLPPLTGLIKFATRFGV